MSWQAQEAVLKYTSFRKPKHIAAYIILHALASLADENGRVGDPSNRKKCPSINTIANLSGFHRNTILTWLPKLVSAGELCIHKCNQGAGRNAYQWYELLLLDSNLTPEKEDFPAKFEDEKPQKGKIIGTSSADVIGTSSDDIGTSSSNRQADIGTSSMSVPDPSTDPFYLDPLIEPDQSQPPTPSKKKPFVLTASDYPPPQTEAEAKYLNHPAVKLWLRVTNRWPGYSCMPHIAKGLGTNPSAEKFAAVWAFWKSKNYDPSNWLGIIDRYQKTVSNQNKGIEQTPSPKPFASQYTLEQLGI